MQKLLNCFSANNYIYIYNYIYRYILYTTSKISKTFWLFLPISWLHQLHFNTSIVLLLLIYIRLWSDNIPLGICNIQYFTSAVKEI